MTGLLLARSPGPPPGVRLKIRDRQRRWESPPECTTEQSSRPSPQEYVLPWQKVSPAAPLAKSSLGARTSSSTERQGYELASDDLPVILSKPMPDATALHDDEPTLVDLPIHDEPTVAEAQ